MKLSVALFCCLFTLGCVCSQPSGTYKVSYQEVGGTCGMVDFQIVILTPDFPVVTYEDVEPHLADFLNMALAGRKEHCKGLVAESGDCCEATAFLYCDGVSGITYETWHVVWDQDGARGEGSLELVRDGVCQSLYNVKYDRLGEE